MKTGSKAEPACLILALLGLSAAIAVMIIIRMNSLKFVGDDAYMTFRVSKNFLAGSGFVCNPGERILSTSTPLWAWLVAEYSLIRGIEPALVFRELSNCFDLLNLLLIYWIASARLSRHLEGGLAALLFSLSWNSNYSSLIGMETPLFVFLLLSSAVLFEEKGLLPRIGAAALAALSFSTRPEGALFCFALLLLRSYQQRRIPRVELFVAGTVTGIYLLWMYIYFGSILPQAALAKSIGYHRQPWQAFQSLISHLRLVFFTPWFDSPNLAVRSILTVLALIFWGAGFRRSPLLFLFTILVILLYILSNPLIFEWYVVALEPSYLIGAVAGIGVLFNRLPASADFRRLGWTSAALLLIIIGYKRFASDPFRFDFVVSNGGYGSWPAMVREPSNRWRLPALGPFQREYLYASAAQQLAADLTPQKSVLATEFGTFGYLSNARMISSIGHVNPEVFKYLPAPREEIGRHINNGITMAMLDGIRPDYILSLETFVRELLKKEEFYLQYRQIYFVPSPVFGSRGFYVFQRKPAAGP